MAEFVMKDMVAKRGLSKQFVIASAATSSEEIGNPVYPPARRILEKHGLRCTGKVARKLTFADYEKNDFLIGMDSENLWNMRHIWRNDTEGKIHLLLDFTDHPRDVDDPWYTGNFEATWRDINDGCQGLLKAVLS